MPATATATASDDLHRLVDAARTGDNHAWTQLVHRFERMLHAIAGTYRLNPQDTDDAIQNTWIKLYEHLDRIRDTNAIAGWLNTTMRREALRLLQTHVREHLTDQLDHTTTNTHDTPEQHLLQTERHHILHHALTTLPDRQRQLMTLIATDTTNYHHISTTLNMPIGSIGPIRARSIARLQRHHQLRDYAAA
ncbi:MAG TPA: sigma-70 family RNA polymerase sigma factor [Solirubrobacteraceae bacterium]|jgi:RNA polymerase sigma factor (sigma-70 family)|nr:sigma-70 family RNA polymerase sigma factor [Solirubrobacteraceae bacterium]